MSDLQHWFSSPAFDTDLSYYFGQELCVCVRVSERERERERPPEKQIESHVQMLGHYSK